MSILVNGQFPPINPIPSSDLTAEERTSAIDFVLRLSYLFEAFDHKKIVNAFLPRSTTYHLHGVVKRQDEVRRFFEDQYGYLVPDVSRYATNHIVDRDEERVVVRYYQHLVRYAWPADSEAIKAGETAKSDRLPAT